MSLLSERFGEVVRRERESKGISQERLGQLAGLDRTYVQRLEGGRYSPTLDTVESLARALQILPSELVARADGSGEDEVEEEVG
ncbi:MAG: helix-turn-helix transcriptional regulator [Solirubrobacterales bacterium]